MVAAVPRRPGVVVLELGPGTGSMTRSLLEVLPPDAKVLALELNGRFAAYLRRDLRDPRLKVLRRDAANAGAVLESLGIARVDAIVSSLGFGNIPRLISEQILDGLPSLLADDGVLTQFQYLHRMRVEDGRFEYFDIEPLLRRRFPAVRRRFILRNLPPAFVYECRPRRPILSTP